MFFNKCKKKNPYLGLAMFSLATAGVISITNKAKKFMKDKMMCVCHVFKREMD